MPDIVLTTINAKYLHASFGLRYLMANLGQLQSRTAMLEFDLKRRSTDMVEAILAQSPRIVGIGVYIWNITQATQLVADLKRVAPKLIVIVGGPEVSYEIDQQDICRLADYVVAGEADTTFAQLCQQLLDGEKPLMKVIESPVPDMAEVTFPYAHYTDRDIAHRVIYVEASRGCPFKCEFCLSSLDIPVRQVPLDPFLDELKSLLDRGVRQFKFVDRTFNLNLAVSQRILRFFLDQGAMDQSSLSQDTPDLFLHFEMIPGRLPDGLRNLITRFPAGTLQFEVGIQSFDGDVMARIDRKQDNAKLEENLRWLRAETGVHVHADLIVGLPGEDVDSFGRGFDRLVALRPQEIQVGMLKRLRGTPIIQHDKAWEMVYSPNPPYEILATKLIDFATMQRMRRFARYWDMVANSGNFLLTTPLIWTETGVRDAATPTEAPPAPEGSGPHKAGAFDADDSRDLAGSPFHGFLHFSDWLYERAQSTHGIALSKLTRHLFDYLTEVRGQSPRVIAPGLLEDYQRGRRRDVPGFLRDLLDSSENEHVEPGTPAPSRQARHLG